jgi:class 3 adenylate cyclase
MGSRMRLIKVDQRNSGLSQRGVPLGPNADDVLAVADHMGLARFALLASGPMGEGALSVAKEHTDRVTKMVMWEFVTSRSWQAASRIRANLAVTSVDEATSAEIIAGTIVGDRFDLLPGWVEVAKVAWSASDFGRTGDSGRAPDPSAEAERAPANPPPDPFAGLEVITCPVLVVVQETGAYGMEDAQRLVSLLPNAKLIVHPYRPLYPPALPSDAPVLAAVEDFLGGPAPARLETLRVSPFRTILFTDVVSSTPLLTQLRDQRMREVMREHDAVMEAAVTGHGGRIVKTIGDAFMAEFAVPSAAVEAAIEAQRQIRERFAASDVPVRIRIGINAGEPIEEGGDLHGASVVIAKRLESAAESDGILVSDVVKQAVAGKEFVFEDRGLVELKGFDEPVRAWMVRWE